MEVPITHQVVCYYLDQVLVKFVALESFKVTWGCIN